MLRIGEPTSLRSTHIFMKSPRAPAVVSLGLTKSGKRVGAAESVTLTVGVALRWLWLWKQSVKPQAMFVTSVSVWRVVRPMYRCFAARSFSVPPILVETGWGNILVHRAWVAR